MPVRSLSSAVFKWPDRESVLRAARAWARSLRQHDSTVRSIHCVGSCARGDWGVGSDLDVIVIIDDTDMSLVERRRRYEPTDVPVPADVFVYTASEWDALALRSPHLFRRLERERVDLLADPPS